MNTQFELGEKLKDEGIQRVAGNNEEWMEAALRAIKAMAGCRYRSTFTADNLRNWVVAPANPNAWGAVFSTAARQGLIERVGYRPSTTPSAHARVVAVWRGKSQ
jgi:hypothetical protein